MENHPIMFVVLAIVGIFKLMIFTVQLIYLIVVSLYKIIVKIITKKAGDNNNVINR